MLGWWYADDSTWWGWGNIPKEPAQKLRWQEMAKLRWRDIDPESECHSGCVRVKGWDTFRWLVFCGELRGWWISCFDVNLPSGGGGQKYYTWQEFQDPRSKDAKKWTQVQENFIKMNDISFIIPNKQKILWNSIIIDRSIRISIYRNIYIYICISTYLSIYIYLYIYMHLTHTATSFWMIFGEIIFRWFPCLFRVY